jgi:transketolase
LHTVKPLDYTAIIRAASETGGIIVAEEHQVGGLGNRAAAAIMRDRSLDGNRIPLEMIGVNDSFGESGKPWQLIKKFGLSAEHIAAKAKTLIGL